VLDRTQPLYWLNAEFLENQRDSNDPAASLLFFPGIVASASSIGFSRPTMSLLAEAYASAGFSGRVWFENTNRSEAYVPRLLELVLQHGGWYEFSPAEIVDKTTYRVLTHARVG